jgi:phosphatidate cytidylyltransferase
MSPKLSPKKSVEGAIGGIVGAALIAAIYLIIVRNYMNIVWLDIVILSGVVAVGAFISIIGDLAASAIKRFYDIKDYGKLIPGHGGILDRFDSVIITAPIIYMLSFYFA